MSDIAVHVEHLSKMYRIGSYAGQKTFREALSDGLAAPARRLRAALRGQGAQAHSREFWALRNVSFEVAHGEVIGIIGRNGAGKSTLLKILSRITEPSAGYAEIHGRVGTLLEVGTGFHPELTGRENVYLNGAILGMSRAEITRKFDEIVAFAEVEEFIDTMVKHYSSGMYLRLAFAVAAHLEPEILIIDEVLAVGDAQFQKKCLGKMGDVAREGRTVLFVSHDLTAINSLCQRAIWLDKGQVAQIGMTREVVSAYLSQANQANQVVLTDAIGSGEIRIHSLQVQQYDTVTTIIDCGAAFTLELAYEIQRAVRGSRMFILIKNQRGEYLFGTSDYDEPAPYALNREPGCWISRIEIPANILKAEPIYITVGADIKADRIITLHEDVLKIDVVDSHGSFSDRHQRVGSFAPLLSWSLQPSIAESSPGQYSNAEAIIENAE